MRTWASRTPRRLKRNSWKFSRRMRRSCTAGRAAASARAAAITAARSSSVSRSMTTRLPRFGALTAEIPTATRATADMARRGRMIPSRCARRRTTSTPATMPRRLTRWAACPPESGTPAGISSARWRRAACTTTRRPWNTPDRPRAWSRATCSISSFSASFRAAEAGTASRGRNTAAEPAA